MVKKKIVLILLSVALVLQIGENLPLKAQAEEETNLKLYAKSAVLMDGESGRVLYEKDGNTLMPNASTTKIMTCILAIEYGNMEEQVSVSSYAASMPKVRLGMTTDDTFYLKDLLYSLMLESHNDSAVAIAEHIGGSVEGFAEMMNNKAKELGCQNTHFITPNGLDAKNEDGIHGTTAADLAHIMSYCIKNDVFLEITGTGTYNFSNIAGTKSYCCNNHNAFLQMMEGALSGKTGFTGNAGYCYVGALKQDDRVFIVALLACGWPNNKTYKWSDTSTLMKYGLENYQYEDIFEYEKALPKLEVTNAVPENGELYQSVYVPVQIEKVPLRVLKQKEEEIHIIYDVQEKLTAPVKKGQKVGKVTYYLGEEKLKEIPITAERKIEKLEFLWYIEYVMRIFFMEKKFCTNL